jgi:hypothetical protein
MFESCRDRHIQKCPLELLGLFRCLSQRVGR